MELNKRIVLASSGQPSANPRLLKEALSLSAAGYKVQVIYCPISSWADPFDELLFRSHPEIEWARVGYHPVQQKWRYRYARARQKLYKLLYNSMGNKLGAATRSSALFSQELVREAKKRKADLYIGHNLGALPAVIEAARYNGALASFDLEDFHRGEDAEHSRHWKRTASIEEKYIPSLAFATTASPLITAAYQKIFPSLSFTTINNCFPLSYAVSEPRPLPLQPVKLSWFSQTIGVKRGLETVIEAMGKMEKGQVTLSLLGNCSVETKNYFLEIIKKNGVETDQVKFMPAVEEREIVGIAAGHHIGLACEEPHILNRELCLTNKVFMYLLAANAVLFSRTKAQALFLEEHPGIGASYEPGDAAQLAGLLNNYINAPASLQQHRIASLQLGKGSLNWDNEKSALLKKIKEVLDQQ